MLARLSVLLIPTIYRKQMRARAQVFICCCAWICVFVNALLFILLFSPFQISLTPVLLCLQSDNPESAELTKISRLSASFAFIKVSKLTWSLHSPLFSFFSLSYLLSSLSYLLSSLWSSLFSLYLLSSLSCCLSPVSPLSPLSFLSHFGLLSLYFI